MTITTSTNAVAVYCASSLGKDEVYQDAAFSVGVALAKAGRPLVFGGGRKGIMGVVSGAALEAGGRVTGVIPYAMVVSGGEKEQTKSAALSKAAAEALFDGQNRQNEETVVVDSMHERKLEMAKRSCGFICLPGGFGTFEELLEVATWSQIGIHNKPIIVINVKSYYEPLRMLIQNGAREGFIHPRNQHLVTFVDGPSDPANHDTYDWGAAALKVLDSWQAAERECYYDWSKSTTGLRGTPVGA